MNSNQIKRNGFSNPKTERHFKKNWTEGKNAVQVSEGNCCGLCQHCCFVGHPNPVDWILCLNPKSEYCHETLDPNFTCLQQEPMPEDEIIVQQAAGVRGGSLPVEGRSRVSWQ
jgi:hypothetical protein